MEQKIITGIASFGMSGKIFHAPLLSHHKKFVLKRIVQRTGDDAQSLYPNVIVSKSVEDLLNDKEIDLIVANTPDASHFELAKRCIEAHKHVVLEKPMAQTVRQAEDLLALAHRTDKMLTVFQNRRWDGDFLTVQQIVKEKRLGRLVEFESHYDRYRNYIQPETWKERSDAGASILYNLGSHMIDQALVLFGMPKAVTAQLRIVRTGGEVDDWYDLFLHYRDVSVTLKGSLLVKEIGPRYILNGTNGSFIKYGLDPQEDALKEGRDPNSEGWGKESIEWYGLLNTEAHGKVWKGRVETRPGNYMAFYDSVADSILNGAKLAVTPEEGANVIRIIEAAKASHLEKRAVELVEKRG